ncbi:ankyrin repeat-containing domain protein [Aspergillus crustosus]
MAKWLIVQGTNVNVPQVHRSALDAAASNGSEDMVRFLIKHGADVNAEGPFDYSIIESFVLLNWPSSIGQILLSSGADPNKTDDSGYTPLFLLSEDSVSALPLLLEYGANINHLNYIGFTPLIRAAHDGIPSVVKALLNHGADMSLKTKYGQTAMEVAVEKGHEEIIQILRDHEMKLKSSVLTERTLYSQAHVTNSHLIPTQTDSPSLYRPLQNIYQ